jgi:hypothetical protein
MCFFGIWFCMVVGRKMKSPFFSTVVEKKLLLNKLMSQKHQVFTLSTCYTQTHKPSSMVDV